MNVRPVFLLRLMRNSKVDFEKCMVDVPRRGNDFFPCGSVVRHYRASVLKEFGKPLEVKEISHLVKLHNDEVRIKVSCCGVNNSDVLTCRGVYSVKPKLPYIPGFEISGEVLEVGENVSQFKEGDRVVAINKNTRSGFAEQSVALAKDVWKLPPSIDYIKAAALVDAYATAYLALVRRAGIKPENTVLITAAAGGLGMAAVDLAANAYQAKVIGVCGTEEKAAVVREKGAWSALSYHRKGMVNTINEVTEGKGVDVIFDAVGGELFLDCIHSIAHEGKVVVAGFASRQIPTMATDLLLPKSFSLIGISLTHYREANPDVYRAAVDEVLTMCSDGDIDPHVSQTFTLEQINEALQIVLERKSTGKVVLNLT